MDNLPNIIAITGPTTVGKTMVSIEIAKIMNAEIISVDSALVYKNMDIGTAKPTIDERTQIKHHLIDIIEPWETYSVSNFIDNAKLLIADLHSKGKNVLFVGGTMLYFKVLIEGLSPIPDVDPLIRMSVRSRSIKDNYQLLKERDPTSAKVIFPEDTQRVQRALEVTLCSKKPYSELIKLNKIGGIGTRLKLIVLTPKDRLALHECITRRFNLMLKLGFLEEVEMLIKNEKMHVDLPSVRCVGYRQAWQYFLGILDYYDFVDKSIVATRNLAKRQLTWIRNWPYPYVNIDSSLHNTVKIEMLTQMLKKLKLLV
jgi:tRNA dimethylallyltransferase